MLTYRYLYTPLGTLLLAGQENCLEVIRIPRETELPSPHSDWVEDDSCLQAVVDQLNRYFSGELKAFSLKLNPQGSVFQKKAWDALLTIPYGETISYEEQAMRIGQPTASRAVGMANGKNPIPIIIPCHRVIGKDGSLTGFSSGLNAKKYLLALENPQEGKKGEQLGLF